MGLFALWAWLLARTLGPVKPLVLSAATPAGPLPFLALDVTWLLLGVGLLACAIEAPGRRAVRALLGAMAGLGLAGYAVSGLVRVGRGEALAWDLANFLQPMHRLAMGLDLRSTWHDDRPLWGDHGSFAMAVFAPLTRLFDDVAVGPILAQAALLAAFTPALYAAARALGLGRVPALGVACAGFAARPLAAVAAFDFHPECALPALLAGLVVAHRRGRLGLFLAGTLAAASLKDMAALTTAGLIAGLLAMPNAREASPTSPTAPTAPISRRATALALAIAAAIAAVDVFVLPAATGWTSYVAMNTQAPVDPAVSASTTLWRALTTGLLGRLHPLGLLSGAPWDLAAALSAKPLVKGASFQYGAFFVPAGVLGAAALFAALARRRPARATTAALTWATLVVALNAPRAAGYLELPEAWEAREARRAEVGRLLADAAAPDDAPIATDACTAPDLMERPSLLPLCQIDLEAFAATGAERWDHPDPRALTAPLVLVRPGCSVHGPCLRAQLEALRAAGYRRTAGKDGLVLLRPPPP